MGGCTSKSTPKRGNGLQPTARGNPENVTRVGRIAIFGTENIFPADQSDAFGAESPVPGRRMDTFGTEGAISVRQMGAFGTELAQIVVREVAFGTECAIFRARRRPSVPNGLIQPVGMPFLVPNAPVFEPEPLIRLRVGPGF